MDFDLLFPNRFVHAGELKGRTATVTIVKVELETFEQKKEKKTKPILSFKETEKQYVLNKTNGLCLKAMFGRDTNKWLGKRITIFPVEVEAFGEMKLAIRIMGSPDIQKTVEVDEPLGQGRLKKTLKVIGKDGKAAAPKPEPLPPDVDPNTGEVIEDAIYPEPGVSG